MSNTAPTSERELARIALTPGEPAGIGPDLAIMLARETPRANIICFADPAVLAERAALLGIALEIAEVPAADAATPRAAGVLQVVPVRSATRPQCGKLDARNARYVLECLDLASDACSNGGADALVTGPLNKAIINDAGIAFTGHTEYLAERLGAALPVMLLAAADLRVALLTTHVPLARVAALVKHELITAVLDILQRDFAQKFAIPRPRIGVCGLNPHAGEQGHLGSEENREIEPAVVAARARGIDVEGPLPADTVFTLAQRKRFDVILAMYHDQGLAPLKALSFGDTVNVTLGLPIIRTSVDHGTALDRAGSGSVDGGSLRAALGLAVTLAGLRG